MRAECQFARAGQGLFYNGLLVDRKGLSFSFVYDCGTSSAATILGQSISSYKEFLGKRLDLLAISHFHRDHVSHVPALISGIELGTVVIPFIRPEMRLLLAAQYEDIDNDEERIRLYSDPAMYFAAHGAERVLIASGRGDYSEGTDFFGGPDDDIPQSVSRDDERRNHTIEIGNSNSYETGLFEDKAVEYLGCFSVIAPSYQWEFRFENLCYDRMQDSFWDDISELLERHNNSFYEILRNKTYTKQLRQLYEENFEGGINDTSLILLSRPLQKGWLVDNHSCGIRASVDCIDCDDECDDCRLKYGYASTLLLGDLSDRYFYRLCKRPIQLPRIIQLAHHGARIKHNLFFDDLCHISRCVCHLPISLVASYGIKNGYGHPDLSSYTNRQPDGLFWQGLCIEMVNERKDFTYTIGY